ncbi:MAG: phosphoglycerate dehydrogenase [Gammaproteobacteria bacterium]
MKRALLLEGIHPVARESLQAAGFEVELLDQSLPANELSTHLADAQLLGIRSKTHVTNELLAQAPNLLAVGAFCIGTNQIDLPACTRHGIGVFNAPFSNTRSVAELALAEIILLLRNLPDKMREMHAGHWIKSAAHSHEVRGKSLGIVGYGKIGMQLSVLAEALGMQVFYYDRVQRLALGNAVRIPTLEALLQRCDIVSLHVDGRASNRGLIDATALGRMKPGTILLNLSRGYVIDLPALAAALESGRLRGAALDVYPEEPAAKDAPFACELAALPNVIMTPHIGGSTEEAQLDIAEYVSARLAAYAASGISTGSVNLPELAPERTPHASRLAHLHENVPGMLAAINRVLADHELNIVSQHLGTLNETGYVLTDIDGRLGETALGKLTRLEHTLRCHQLPSAEM